MKAARKPPTPGTSAHSAYLAYLSGLAEGDSTVVCSGPPHFKCVSAKVTQATESSLFAFGVSMARATGLVIDKTALIKHYILQPTDDLLNHIERKACEDYLSDVSHKRLKKVPDDVVFRVTAILREYV